MFSEHMHPHQHRFCTGGYFPIDELVQVLVFLGTPSARLCDSIDLEYNDVHLNLEHL